MGNCIMLVLKLPLALPEKHPRTACILTQTPTSSMSYALTPVMDTMPLKSLELQAPLDMSHRVPSLRDTKLRLNPLTHLSMLPAMALPMQGELLGDLSKPPLQPTLHGSAANCPEMGRRQALGVSLPPTRPTRMQSDLPTRSLHPITPGLTRPSRTLLLLLALSLTHACCMHHGPRLCPRRQVVPESQ